MKGQIIHRQMNDIITKHNELSAQVAALEGIIKQVASFTASEMGKIHGTFAGHIATLGRTTQGLDYNVLALAGIVKELVGQLTQIDFLFKKLSANGLESISLGINEEEGVQIKSDAEEWFKELMTSAFKSAREQIEEAEKEQIAKEAETRKQSEIEAEFKAAQEAEKAVVSNISGGPGAEFPEGAEIFGGM